MECTKVNCPMQAGTKTDNCGENCPWRTTVKTRDLISRAAFRSSIQTVLNDTTCPIHIAAEIEQYLELEPAVDAVPVVHARWVYEHGDPDMIPCSVCGYQVFRYNNTHYCPNCGAKMDGERRDDDA